MPIRRMGRPGLIGTMARTAVVAGTASATVGAVSRHQQKKYGQQDASQQAAYEQRQPQYAQPQMQAAPADAGEADYVAELRQLAQLKNQGIITEEEFQAKKAKILGI